MHAGYRVGQFILERRLGEGGMAEVWLGRNVHLSSLAAVKFLNEQYASREDIAGRFLNEGRRQGALDHPNIVKVYGFEYAEARSFLIMQYVEGEALDQRLHRTGPMTIEQALPIANGILQALEFAHSRHIVHRDVKPSNVLIDGQGTAYLGDFGIVLAVNEKRLTQTGTVMGTPHYMSPEQIARPMDIDHRSDIYSFGCVLYEMLTGATPFDHVSSAPGDTDFALKMAHLQTPPPLPRQRNSAISEAVERIILQCLAKDPAHRFANCGQVREALAHATAYRVPPIVKPRRIWPAVAGLALLAMGGAAAAYWPKQPTVELFVASSSTVVKGRATMLRWRVKDAKTVQISGLGQQPASGYTFVTPNTNTVFLLTGQNVWKKAEQSLRIQVIGGARIVKFELTPAKVRPYEESTLSWEVSGATQVVIGGVPAVNSGKRLVRVRESTAFVMTAMGADGVKQQEQRLLEVVQPPPLPLPKPAPAAPQVLAFRFEPPAIQAGGSAELQWDVQGATKVVIGPTERPVRGSISLTRVSKDIIADLTADGPGGRVTRRVVLQVRSAPVERPTQQSLQVVTFRSRIDVGSQGTTTNLIYDVPGATRVVIEPEGGVLTQPSGIVSVFPTRPTVYTLTATGPNGEQVTQELRVNIHIYDRRPPVVERGPSWGVLHHHSSGRPPSCQGTLFARTGRLIFQSRLPNHGFDVVFSEVIEVKSNSYVLGAGSGFHVKSSAGNFNFVTNDSADSVVAQINRAIGQ